MKILTPSTENIHKAALALCAGELVGIPTETVYGLAGDGLNPEALAKIFNTKERPTFDPLILHIADISSLPELVDYTLLSKTAQTRLNALIKAFWPGPLTLVLPKNRRVPDLATSGLPSVAIRMPRHPVAHALIKAAGRPLAAPSANRFGRISPTRAEHVQEELGDRIHSILDGGPCEIGVESTIVQIEEDGELTLLRPGGVSVTQIAEATHSTPLVIRKSMQGAQLAPGMLESHYAPSKPLITLPAKLSSLLELPKTGARTLGVLVLSMNEQAAEEKLRSLTHNPVVVRSLSENGDPAEMARNLFSSLRELDQSKADLLLCEPCPDGEGLLHAIADRLRRASAKR